MAMWGTISDFLMKIKHKGIVLFHFLVFDVLLVSKSLPRHPVEYIVKESVISVSVCLF